MSVFRVSDQQKPLVSFPRCFASTKTWKQDYNAFSKRFVDNPVYRRMVCPLNRNDTLPAQSSPAEAALSRKPRRKINS